MQKPPRIVNDTNVWLSALYFSGKPAYIQSISESVSLQGKDFGLRDEADNMVLETAVIGKCSFLITGDKDLLTLKKYKNIYVVTPSKFLNQQRQDSTTAS